MKIDFKGYKFAISSNNQLSGNVFRFNELSDLRVTDDFYIISPFRYGRKVNTLHTNPDYKASKYDGEFLAKTNESKEMIYTQEMKDKGEAPKVGMDVLYSGEKVEVINIYHIGDSTVLTLINNKTSGVSALYFNSGEGVNIDVIDTRTDEEKAIDDLKLSYDNWDNEATEKDTLQWIFDDIKAGKVHGVSFTRGKK